MISCLTVGELKKELEGVPDEALVRLSSDTGVDQGQLGGIIVVESAYYAVTHFYIYVNEYDESEVENE